jgi:hypothetical protein
MESYQGLPIRHLIDVGMYLNAFDAGHCVGIPDFQAAFRVHDDQLSSEQQPGFSPAVFEWELFVRGELTRGRLAPSAALNAVRQLELWYRNKPQFPELRMFVEGLGDLRLQIESGEREFLTRAFRSTLETAHEMIEGRLLATPKDAPLLSGHT